MRPYDITRRALPAALLAFTLGTTTACDRLLAVDNPARVPEDALADPGLIPALEAAAIQQFQCAFGNYVATSGVLSGEYFSSSNFVDSHPWEWRGVEQILNAPGACAGGRNTTALGFYTPLQQARFQAEELGRRAEAFTDAQLPNRTRILTEAAAYAGYAYVLLGEGMCDMTVDGGPKITRAQTWTLAEQRFTTAITLAGTSTNADLVSLRNMALVGRARARLNLNNLAGAAADAAQVPASFVRNAEYSETTPARENRVYNLTIRNDFISVADAYRTLTLANGQPDPRVRVVQPTPARRGNDGVTPVFQQTKYTGSGAAPLPIATWAEAQLILAEASTGQAAIDALNRVRAANSVPNLTAAEIADLPGTILEDRRRTLFSQGNRYGDMLRKNLPFQKGVNRKGQTYSDLTCVPLPYAETRNNPNFKEG
jgi:starch-binding outer membrane protein, SusD/RagB family